MQNMSTDFMTQINSQQRELHCKIDIQTSDSSMYYLTSNDIISGSLKVDAACFLDGFELGTCFASDMGVTLKNGAGQWNNIDLDGATVWAYSGIRLPDETIEYSLLGTFIIDEPGRPNEEIEIKATDRMVLLDRPFSSVTVSYPITNYNMLLAICSACNIPVSGKVIDRINMSNEITDAPEGEFSCRDIVEQICIMSVGFGHMTRSGEFEIKTLPDIYAEPITLTNLIQNGDFSNGDEGWGFLRVTNPSYQDGFISFQSSHPTNSTAIIYQDISSDFWVANHEYFISVKTNHNYVGRFDIAGYLYENWGSVDYENYFYNSNYTSGENTINRKIQTAYNGRRFAFISYTGNLINTASLGEIMLIDLTESYGAGNEPTAAEFAGIIEKYFCGWFDGTKTIYLGADFTLTPDNRFNLTQTTEPVTITGLRYRDSEEDILLGTDEYALSMDRLNILSDSNRDSVLTSIFNKIEGYTYSGFEAEYIGNPAIDLGDSVLNLTKDGGSFNSLVSSISFRHNGTCTVSAEAKARTAIDFVSKNSKRLATISQSVRDVDKSLTNYQQASAQLSDLLTIGFGLYRTEEKLEDNSVIQYMHNKPTLAESEIIWKQTALAWAFSDDGGTTWSGYDVSGNLIARTLSVIGINAEWINTGSLMVGGAGHLGKIELRNESDEVISTLDKDGINVDGLVKARGFQFQEYWKPMMYTTSDVTDAVVGASFNGTYDTIELFKVRRGNGATGWGGPTRVEFTSWTEGQWTDFLFIANANPYDPYDPAIETMQLRAYVDASAPNYIELTNGILKVPQIEVAEGYVYHDTIYYKNQGSFSFVKANYPKLRAVRVKLVGAGGGGGGAASTSTNQASGGSGGGGGAYAESFILASDIPSSVTVKVGWGGNGGYSTVGGGNGESSSFGTLVIAAGGSGGGAQAAGNTTATSSAGFGGTTGTGDIFYQGGGGGTSGRYVEGATMGVIGGMGGSGGESHLGGRVRGSAVTAGGDGYNGRQYGGGGSGGHNRSNQNARGGGVGADGVVIIELYM